MTHLDQLHVKCKKKDPDQAQDAPAVGYGQVDVGAEARAGVHHADEEYVSKDTEEESKTVKDNFVSPHTAAEDIARQVL